MTTDDTSPVNPRRNPPHDALNLLVMASRVSPILRAAMRQVEDYVNATTSVYDDATDCVICPMLATDRDDALADARVAQDERDAARRALYALGHAARNGSDLLYRLRLSEAVQECHEDWLDDIDAAIAAIELAPARGDV